MEVVAWTALGFATGSLMFSYWIGQGALGVDVRDYGPDRNPGAGNLWRAGGGWRLGVPGAVLDYMKALLPIALARSAGMEGWALVPIALAPYAGHVFSPILGFRGGKGVAATFGIWTALSGPGAPLAFGLACLVFWILSPSSGWTMALGAAGLLAYLVFRDPAAHLFVIWAVNSSLMLWKHYPELRQPFRLRHRHTMRTL